MSVTAKALWYIESHLDGALSLDAIADVAGVSRFHLSRAFASSTGVSIAGYARARRLGEAARALAAGAPDILAVALAARYGSHEAFTRAFRQQFRLTPEQVRSQAHTQNLHMQEPIRMNADSAVRLTQPRLIKAGAMLMFGISERCPIAGNPSIPSQWMAFLPHLGHIDHQVGNVAYGAIYNSDDSGATDYMCAVEVTQFPEHPANFTRLRIPPQTFAVFHHAEHISAIASTWKAIWEHGLSDAGLQAQDGPALERYDEKFDGRTGLGGVDLWVPVFE